MLSSIIPSTGVTVESFLICLGVALAIGIGTAFLCRYGNRESRSFLICLAMLPAVIQTVIMLVNGSIGAGIAVAGAFSLVRFRSTPGSAREISSIFLSMASGLAVGMGYIWIALLFFAVMAVFLIVLEKTKFGAKNETERMLKITIPEDLDYDGVFDDLMEKYTSSCELQQVKTVNMGTMYELKYLITLKSAEIPKDFIDSLRCRNGNLKISCTKISEKNTL